MRAGRLAPILLGVTVMGCGVGRIPGLDEPSGQSADARSEIADAAPDESSQAAPLVGSGSTGGIRSTGGAQASGGATGRSGTPGAGGQALVHQGGAVAATTICSGEVTGARASRDPADVLLVLDRSGSMVTEIDSNCRCDPSAASCSNPQGCPSRWESLVEGIGSAMSATPFLHWGLKLFGSPGSDSCVVTDGVEVPIGPDSAAEIQTRIAATRPDLGTPTAAAMKASTAYLRTLTQTNSKVILLATDGEPNCADTGSSSGSGGFDMEGALEEISAARDLGILVYVIGIGPSVPNLDAFAQAGGTGRYFPAGSHDDLTAALVSVSKAALCTFALASAPPDPANVAVYLDGSVVPRDASSGWGFGRDSQTILLHGSSCARALDEPDSIVEAVFGCASSLPPRTLP